MFIISCRCNTSKVPADISAGTLTVLRALAFNGGFLFCGRFFRRWSLLRCVRNNGRGRRLRRPAYSPSRVPRQPPPGGSLREQRAICLQGKRDIRCTCDIIAVWRLRYVANSANCNEGIGGRFVNRPYSLPCHPRGSIRGAFADPSLRSRMTAKAVWHRMRPKDLGVRMISAPTMCT